MTLFRRLALLTTLTAFLGLSALEAFHSHTTLQTEANCSVCQIAHKTPTLLNAASSAGPQWTSTPAHTPVAAPSYIHFLVVSHGLSPPAL